MHKCWIFMKSAACRALNVRQATQLAVSLAVANSLYQTHDPGRAWDGQGIGNDDFSSSSNLGRSPAVEPPTHPT